MAYTTLPTQSAGQTASASGWANLVKANFESMMHLHARKGSDQSVTSSTVFVSESAMQLAVGISEVWLFKFHLRYEASTAGDLKVSFSMPTSGQIDAGVGVGPVGPTGSFQDAQWQSLTTIDGSPNAFAGAGAGTVRTLTIEGTYTGAGTAGTVILRYAQQVSDGTATKILTNSTLWVVQLA